MFALIGLGSLGWTEVLIVLGIALLVFGRRIPDVARGLGRSFIEFRRGLAGGDDRA